MKTIERYKFYSDRECEYFPCHANADPEGFNCRFCYCPLYALGEGCGGNYTYTEQGVKDCSHCMIPHRQSAYDYIVARFDQVAELARRKTEPR